MRMKLRILIILPFCLWVLLALGAEQWKLHPTFDGSVFQIVDTPDFTYIVSDNQPCLPNVAEIAVPTRSLFRYDKKGDELIALNTQNLLSDFNVSLVKFNPDKKYLVVAYANGNIDIIKGDDVINIPGLKLSSSDYSRKINNISFYSAKNEIYLSTDFGLVVLDDHKGEVRYTQLIPEAVTGVGRLGNTVFIGTETGLFTTTPNSHQGIDDGDRVEDISCVGDIVPMDDKLFVVQPGSEKNKIDFVVLEGGLPKKYSWIEGDYKRIERCKTGLAVFSTFNILLVDSKLEGKNFWIQEEDAFRSSALWNPDEVWIDWGRKGLVQKSMTLDDAGISQWKKLKEGLIPNASNPFKVTDMVYHPDYGMLVRNHGVSPVFTDHNIPSPDLICSYRNSSWKSLSTTYRLNDDTFLQWNPSGIAIDPVNRNHVYSGSVIHGMVRLDLSDPTQSLRLGRTGDYANGRKRYIEIQPDSKKWDQLSYTSRPTFDKEGNLWFCGYDHDEEPGRNLWLYLWTPDARKRTNDIDSYQPIKKWNVKGPSGDPKAILQPLMYSSSKNYLIYYTGQYKDMPAIIDHKGTLDATTDDMVFIPIELIDQDGSKIDFDNILTMFEDQNSGLVWCGTDKGLFTFKPSDLIKTGSKVNRIKVSRNDGTNLADYLLDGVSVNCFYEDSSKKKWIGTMGGGIVVVSSDGTEVVKTYTSENSGLPDNDIYAICYNPENHSMMVSTSKGIAEMFLTSSKESSSATELKVYPNPVRPDFYGYVTIEGLADNALVKIADSAGNIVKELGFAAGGEAQWDVTNFYMKRVPTGVYYILASNGPDEVNYSKSAKIMVVN